MATQTTETRGAVTQYLTFSLMGEEYAVGILKVREILEYETVTRIPSMPAWIRGAINLRGSVVPVIDLAVRLGCPPTSVSRRACIVILDVEIEGKPTVMGVLVDAVSQVIEIRDGEVEPPPSFGTQARTEDLVGIANVEKKLVLILDVDKVLSRVDVSGIGPGAETPAPASDEEEG